ncbi:TPA: hypothetical protein ACJEU7_002184 [Acinetobacter baumannii]|uniref:hypothetical protein n=1 Tax=Acinetobacter baumannii TaxID=470 RepID=UPI0022502A6F|nr:hypothetical protein [Acinetobacter baumannii]MCX3035227.1 hypothetical protein [Acinetobacter baumannii]
MVKDNVHFKVLLILKYGVLIDIRGHGRFYIKKNELAERLLKDCCYKASLNLSEKIITNEGLLKIKLFREHPPKNCTLLSEPNLLGSFYFEQEGGKNLDKPRVMIKDSLRELFLAGDKHHVRGKDLYVSKLGRSFEFKKGELKELVCYVYLDETTTIPNWTIEAYMEYMAKYALMVKTITTDGVKPRHTARIANEIKNAPSLYFDFRKTIIGNSWFAVGDEHIYYILCDTAINDFAYNVKVDGRLIQAWSMHKGMFPFTEDEMSECSNYLINSNIFPRALANDSNLRI